jgi:hypothetical protein
MKKKSPINHINAYFPFVFGEKLDPRNIFTVGEQVLSEHVFGFNARTDVRNGFDGVLSEVTFSSESPTVTVKLKQSVKHPDGSLFPFQSFCNGIDTSLKGTRHAPYAAILDSIDCKPDDNSLAIHFKQMPSNIRFLFTLPDFCISEPTKMPMDGLNSAMTATGPYYATDITPDGAKLRINKYYPTSLRANNIETVDLKKYAAGGTSEFIANLNPDLHHAAYFFGYSLNPTDLDKIKAKGYKLEMFPTEWVVYLITNPNLDQKIKDTVRSIVDTYRTANLKSDSLGDPAYSIAPTDRSFALKAEDYSELFSLKTESEDVITQSLTIATLAVWVEIPFFKKMLEYLKKRVPGLKVEVLPSKDIMELFSNKYDFVLSPLGISQSDPLTHLSFLESTLNGFNKIISKDQIAKIAVLSDSNAFDTAVKNIERAIVKSGLIIPIAHFPGVVAYRSDFIKNDNFTFGWGIQTWAFQVD